MLPTLLIWQALLSAAIVGDCRSIPGVSGKLILFAKGRPADGPRSLRDAGFDEPFGEQIAMNETAQVAAEHADADGRADPVARLDKELGLFNQP